MDSSLIFKFVSTELSLFGDFQDVANTALLGSYESAGRSGGFDATKLFFDDVARRQPFDPTVSIPPAATSVAERARRDYPTR